MRIPFDSLVLRAVVDECAPMAGCTLEHCAQPNAESIVLYVGEHRLLLSCDARFFRAHLSQSRHRSAPEPYPLGAMVKSRLVGCTVQSISQIGFDRILHIKLQSDDSSYLLIAELMGKHSNLILVDGHGRILAAAKSIGSGKSKRIVMPGTVYTDPPFPKRLSLLQASDGSSLNDVEGASPFLVSLMISTGLTPSDLREIVATKNWHPCTSEVGAYPIDVSALVPQCTPIASISKGLEGYFAKAQSESSLEDAKRSLIGQLRRIEAARGRAIHDLNESLSVADRAASLQHIGELLLVHAHEITALAPTLSVTDFDGQEVTIKVDADLTPQQNAAAYFAKAKRAKLGAPLAKQRVADLSSELISVQELIKAVEEATSYSAVTELHQAARNRKWLHVQYTPDGKTPPPYEGKRIREVVDPRGFVILYGENSEANDYLTTRVARPDDLWLHVRGASSAHVVIRSNRKPERIPKETVEFAALIAVKHSSLKHSSFVPVDYTLRKFVRKPRSSGPGKVAYERERTLHIDSAKP